MSMNYLGQVSDLRESRVQGRIHRPKQTTCKYVPASSDSNVVG